jgi:ABC-type Mn2+/Zn2+ transport systems, permease components
MTDIIIRALVVGILVSLCSSLLGVPLVLKRYSMIGDGLSHVAFGAMSVALALNAAPLPVALPIVVLSAVLLLRMGEKTKIRGDAAIALIAGTSLAIGVIAARLSGGTNIDINSYMFGSIWGVEKGDLYLCVPLAAIVLICFAVFYNIIFAVTFDENFASARGLNVGAYNMLLALLTALTVVVGMRLVGTLLISSLIIFPSISAMRVLKSFKGVILCAGILSVVCFSVGIFVTYLVDIPTGAGIVVVNAVMFFLFSLYGKFVKIH